MLIDIVFSDSANTVECLLSGLSIAIKRLIRNGSLGTGRAITNCHVKHTPPRDDRNVKHVRNIQIDTYLGIGIARKFDSGAEIL